MLKLLSFLISCSFLMFPILNGENPLGYIFPSTVNIGDDFQAIAVKRFLKKDAIALDRDFISTFKSDTKIKAIISGWFMQDKQHPNDIVRPLPDVSWPPAPAIEPFFISIHFTPALFSTFFSDKNSDYLKKYAPIGARDFFTLNELQKRNIPSYFSGCLTLTLENHHTKRDDIIYLVDLDKESVNYIKSQVKSSVVVLTHKITSLQFFSLEHRLQYAENILELYRKAKCVVTTRLHATLPCLAFETPVLMVLSNKKGSIKNVRLKGLVDHARYCSKAALRKGLVNYDFNNPPQNPTTYIPIKNNLIKIMTEWVEENS